MSNEVDIEKLWVEVNISDQHEVVLTKHRDAWVAEFVGHEGPTGWGSKPRAAVEELIESVYGRMVVETSGWREL